MSNTKRSAPATPPLQNQMTQPYPALYVGHFDAAVTALKEEGYRGHAGCGAVIRTFDGKLVRQVAEYGGLLTVNEAEYTALICLLQAAIELNIQDIAVYGDSQLVVRQVTGEYEVKEPRLLPYFHRARGLLTSFDKWSLAHVKRDANKEADALSRVGQARRDAA